MVPGGGACYTYMLRYKEEAEALFADEEERVAVEVLCEAMSEPIRMIARNAGVLGDMVLEKVKNQEWGYGYAHSGGPAVSCGHCTSPHGAMRRALSSLLD